MSRIRFHLVIYRYEAILAMAILLLTGSIAVSSKDSERAFPPAQRYPYKIALTFDDGPHAGHTERLLDVLRKQNVRATFFVVGSQVIKHPELLKKISAQGHEIENHTNVHPNLKKLSRGRIRHELEITSELIKQITGQKCVYFRPPGGRYNSKVLEVARSLGLRMALWTVFPKDHQETDYNIIAQRILSKAHDGAVVILHSGITPTVAALPVVIKELRDKGYYFATLSQLEELYPRDKLAWLK